MPKGARKPAVYYRYFSHPKELDQLKRHRLILSTNPAGGGKTWYTTERYEDPYEAQKLLALKSLPTHRVGPVSGREIPDFDVCSLRQVDPAYGFQGGGWEVCTTHEVYIFGCYHFDAGDWEAL